MSGKRFHPWGLLLLHPDEWHHGYEIKGWIRAYPRILVGELHPSYLVRKELDQARIYIHEYSSNGWCSHTRMPFWPIFNISVVFPLFGRLWICEIYWCKIYCCKQSVRMFVNWKQDWWYDHQLWELLLWAILLSMSTFVEVYLKSLM